MTLPGPTVNAPRLLEVPLAALHEVPVDEANAVVVAFRHYLGPSRRPFRQQGFVLEVLGRPVSVTISASTVSDTVQVARDGSHAQREEVVELSRLASAEPWATRVMLRLWRQLCAPAWPDWTVRYAVAYSQNERHPGDVYRFDGWTKVREDAGSSGGALWSRKRFQGEAVYGKKTLWVWRYAL